MRGSKPGERRGGRKAGVPNRATLKREAEIAAQKHAAGLKLGKEVMSEAMNYFFGLAARYQPHPTNKNANEGRFEKYLKIAASIACDLAPYESPRMQSIAFSGHWDLGRLSDAELKQLEALSLAAAGRPDHGGDEETRH